MKIAFRELETTGDNIRVSFDNKNTFENYDKNTALADGIPVPEECTDLDNIVIKTDELETSNLSYEISADLLSQGDLSSKLDSRIKDLKIPNGVTSIDDRAFWGCSGLTSITIPDSVTSIGTYAFNYCSNLMSINIPDNVTFISPIAFINCNQLKNINVSENNEYYSADEYALYDKTKLRINRFYRSIDAFTIPDSVMSIGENAFYGCSSLTSIEIPDSVTSINDYAFQSCSSLTNIIIPDSVKSIHQAAFRGCKSLTNITIPSTITSIDMGLFSNCKGLTSINIPSSVTSIGDSAFYNCSSLVSLEIPNSVTFIDAYAFYGCSSLTSIEIPDSVTSIGPDVFKSCNNLQSIIVSQNFDQTLLEGKVPLRARIIVQAIITQEDLDKGSDYLQELTRNNSVCKIADGVTTIEEMAFNGCSSLTSIEIPNSVISIGIPNFHQCDSLLSITVSGNNQYYSSDEYALYNKDKTAIIKFYNQSITTFTIPSTVTSICDGSFASSISLTSIVIPKSVTSIGEQAFYNCTELTNINYKGTEAQWKNITKNEYWNLACPAVVNYNYAG